MFNWVILLFPFIFIRVTSQLGCFNCFLLLLRVNYVILLFPFISIRVTSL